MQTSIVLIIPTGVGAEIGGHAGDGTPVAKMLAAACDNLITHPNVVNASDINEMTENTLYVEGSTLDMFLEGKLNLKKVKRNKILCVTNAPAKNEIINSVSAARATMGAEIELVELKTPLKMVGYIEDGRAKGDISGAQKLIDQLGRYKFDALAISSPIEVDRETKMNYFKNGGVNPWGGVEALLSRTVARAINKPVAHAPVENTTLDSDKELFLYNEVVDPRVSAEMVSVSYLHCVLKGLHKAPRLTFNDGDLTYEDVDYLVTPDNCFGGVHQICRNKGIPVIVVKENQTCQNREMPDDFIMVENYWEAAGIILAHKAGIDPRSVRRPLAETIIHRK